MRTTIQSARSNTRPRVRCLCSAKVIKGGSARTRIPLWVRSGCTPLDDDFYLVSFVLLRKCASATEAIGHNRLASMKERDLTAIMEVMK